MADVKMVDSSEVTSRLMQLWHATPQIVEHLLTLVAAEIVTRAKQLCPVDTGALRASISWKSNGFWTVIIYAPLEYAAAQHEHTEYNHPNGGEAKYIEKPLLEVGMGDFPAFVAERLLLKINEGLAL